MVERAGRDDIGVAQENEQRGLLAMFEIDVAGIAKIEPFRAETTGFKTGGEFVHATGIVRCDGRALQQFKRQVQGIGHVSSA